MCFVLLCIIYEFTFSSVLTLHAKSSNFSERVLQHLNLNVYCKPYLLYVADVISWTEFELSSL